MQCIDHHFPFCVKCCSNFLAVVFGHVHLIETKLWSLSHHGELTAEWMMFCCILNWINTCSINMQSSWQSHYHDPIGQFAYTVQLYVCKQYIY